MENKRHHLELIQGVINRLSQSSFLLKGWSVVLVAALFTLAANRGELSFIILAYFPAIAFWGLDAYYLQQERLQRKLYDYVRTFKEEDIDFSMDTTVVKQQGISWINAVFSKTLLAFHGVLIGSIFIVMIIVSLVY